MVKFTRKENSTNTKRKQYQYKKRGILRLLSAPVRYISRRVRSIYKQLLKKTDNNNVEKLQNKSIDKLKGIVNWEELKIGIN